MQCFARVLVAMAVFLCLCSYLSQAADIVLKWPVECSWFLAWRLPYISKLQKAQNLLTRVVTCSPKSCTPRTLLQQLHWLPIKHHIEFKIENITFRTLHCSQPAYLRSSLHACHSTRSLRLSNTNLLSALFFCTSFGSRSFSVAAPKIWNSLPLSLRARTSPDTFRRHPLLPAGLPIHLTPLLLHLRFGFADHCARL